MISVEDWAEIRRLHRAEGLPIKQIARIRNVSRNTVRAALRSDGPPRYERAPKGSVADGFEPRIRELLMAFPTMPSTRDRGADRVAVFGPDAERRGSRSCARRICRRIRRRGRRMRPGSWRRMISGSPTCTVPVGFGQVRTAKQLPVLTMVCGYSRWASALLVPSRNAEDLYRRAGGSRIEALGAVPRLLVWDGEGAVGTAGGRTG